MSLTDEQIDALMLPLYANRVAAAMMSIDDRKSARIIESATAAPLLERIKELERRCEMAEAVAAADNTLHHAIDVAQKKCAELEQQLEEQQRTIECLNKIINDHGPTTENLTIVGRLEQQLEEARKDAWRYRWLRAHWGRIEESYQDDKVDSVMLVDDADGWFTDPDSLDAAVDAATSKEQA